MYGDRARIGLIIPSSNTTIEPEFNTMAPDGISIHTTRLMYQYQAKEGAEHLVKMAEGIQQAAELLATAGVNIIAYGCTTGSLAKGSGWDQELIRRIESSTGIPATTTATAVIRAFKEIGVEKVTVASPYSEEQNKMEEEFFTAHGINVVNIKGLDIHREELIGAPVERTYRLVHEVDIPEAEAIFISCTNFKSITVIEKLEEELQKYIFSSNTATMWDVLKRMGLGDQIKGYGKLFDH